MVLCSSLLEMRVQSLMLKSIGHLYGLQEVQGNW